MKIVAALLLTATPLLGCAGKAESPKSGPQTDSRTQTIQISYDDLMNQKQVSRSITLATGEFLQVSLGSNASTGYQWADKMLLSDPKVMTQTGHENIAPAADQPGASGREVWMLQAMAPGTTTASTTYGQPWPGGDKESWVFSVNVVVD